MPTFSNKCDTKYCRGRKKTGRRICSKCVMRAWRSKNPVKAMFAALKHNAKRRGKQFDLTIEQWTEFVTQHNMLDNRGKNGWSLSVDRIDQERGYAVDNIRPLTLSENSIRGTNHDPNPF